MTEEPELTDGELREFREILIQERRMRWLWASVRRWLAWIAGVAAAIVAFRDDIAALFRGFGQ